MKTPISLKPGTVAAIFIDLQEEHRQDPRYLVEGFPTILANVQRLQAAARRNQVPLYHWAYIVDLDKQDRPFHPLGEDGKSAFSDKSDPLTEICHEVAPAKGEALLIKAEASAFRTGPAAGDIKSAGIEWLVISGVWTEACIDASVKDAVAKGFRVLLVKDACGSGSAAMHQTGILNLANRLYGGAVTDTDGAFRLLAGETFSVWQVEGSVPLRFSFDNAAALYADL
ncbi:isochorismatase family protein [Mesorhizobium sp. M7A.F.Ca.US.003.02.1.1]|uniref:isochorismatase family protein n=1 Tax=Mesorhizobium sp. M7A.F.Ca.US.003.02.1.1 TaxID=2496710 RepID=UPI000FCC0335|nr:isochorismatase family protein [Mesorhizobium sp. M7A.F.Ca.US.003.02.1.1]RUZ44439.1 isochorismatase family protein [Mesorhizobium sp. M7A.F.Ca.US.003.02.1.1]